MDPATLAAAALAAVTTYLMGLGKDAVDESAKSVGKSVFEWVKGRLTGAAGKEAVGDIEKAPEAEENRQALQTQIVKALRADSQAAAELAALLPGDSFVRQTVNIEGSNNIGINASGSHVSVNR